MIDGGKITRYYGIVSGETIIGANVFRDLFASIRDIVGGRSGSYEEVLREAKETALREMEEQARALGANAVIGVDLDYETVGGSGSMLDGDRCRYGCDGGVTLLSLPHWATRARHVPQRFDARYMFRSRFVFHFHDIFLPVLTVHKK